jgi:WD40 repeat protein
LYLWDLRTCRRKNTLKGFAGSIRDVSLSEDGDHLAAVGLDRFMRLYAVTETNYELETACYLKNKLTCCVLINDPNATASKHHDNDDGDESNYGSDVVEELDESDKDDEYEEEESDDGHEEVMTQKSSKRRRH